MELCGFENSPWRPHTGPHARTTHTTYITAVANTNTRGTDTITRALLSTLGSMRRTGVVGTHVLRGRQCLPGHERVVLAVYSRHCLYNAAGSHATAARANTSTSHGASAFTSIRSCTGSFDREPVHLREEHGLGWKLWPLHEQCRHLLRPELRRVRPIHIGWRRRWIKRWLEWHRTVLFRAV